MLEAELVQLKYEVRTSKNRDTESIQRGAGVRKCLNALPAYMSLFTKFSVAVLFAPLGVPTEDLDIRWFYFRYVSLI